MKNTLRLLHVVDSLEPGGLERVVTDLALEQHAQGFQVKVFSINSTTGFAPELIKAGIEVVIGAKKNAFDFKVIRLLRKMAKGSDLVHAHNFMPNYYAATALLGLFKRPTLVGSCHDMGTRLNNKKLRFFYKWSLTKTARVAMVGQQVYERYTNTGLIPKERASTVLNGIPTARFSPSNLRKEHARKTLALSSSDMVIGCVGRLVELKNHQIIINALPALLKKNAHLRLVIIGYGELEKSLIQLAESIGVAKHLIITGQRHDVADLLPAFDIFALPSRTEGLSIALLEACATGLPVIATEVGGNPEIIRHGVTGLLVPVDDASALSKALEQLINDADMRNKLGGNANAWVQENASIESMGKAYESFYLQALKKTE